MVEPKLPRSRAIPRGLMFAGAALPVLLAGMAQAQRAEGTALQPVRIRGYAMYSYVRPDYYGNQTNNGFTLGGDIDGFRLLPHTEIGLDARYTLSSGPITTQHYYGGGPRLSLLFGRFRPYGDFLFGHGTGVFKHSFDPNYTHDSTGVIAYGGGFDYQLNRSWAVRVDAQEQRWRFSKLQPYFHPAAISVGASYQFHFRSRTGPGL